MSRRNIFIFISIFTTIVIILMLMLNSTHKYNKLSISESKWNNIIESRTENINLKLDDIKFNDNKLIIDEKNNTIYYSVINNSKNKYNPKVNYSVNKGVKLAILSDEITSEKIKNNYDFKIIIYDEKEYHIYNLRCTDLPMLNISYNENEEINSKNTEMELYLFDNLSNIPNKITISKGKIKQEGEKYIFSLYMLTPGKNKRGNKLSILRMKPNSEYILTKFNNSAQKKEIAERNTKIENRKPTIELFLNGEYKGTFSIESQG